MLKVSKRVRQWMLIWNKLSVEGFTNVNVLSQLSGINFRVVSWFLKKLEQVGVADSMLGEHYYSKRSHKKVKWYRKIKDVPFESLMFMVQTKPRPYTIGVTEQDSNVWRNRYWKG